MFTLWRRKRWASKLTRRTKNQSKKRRNYVVENVDKLPSYFISAMDITSHQHVKVLAAAQKHVDNSISKTCNGANDDTVESVDKLYRMAKDLGCKACQLLPRRSREGQVLTSMKAGRKEDGERKRQCNRNGIYAGIRICRTTAKPKTSDDA